MDIQRYIEALEKGDAPNAIVPLIVAEARKEALGALADDLVAAHSPGWSGAYGPIVYTDYDAGRTEPFFDWLQRRGDRRPSFEDAALGEDH